ncbi:Ig-like domain-containing protein, partial [Photobacterium proteolyticum]
LNYTPNADFNGSDSFTFAVTDNEGGVSEMATVELTIEAVNDAPVAENDVFEFDKDDENQYSFSVLSNDSDVDNDTLVVTSAFADIGNVSIENSQLVFAAPSGFIGSLELTYLISDGNGETDTATISLTINGLFDELAPMLTLPEDVVINATALYTKIDLGVAKAVDVNGNSLPVSLVDDHLMFPPGITKAYWQATDADGHQSISAQNVQVHPLISIGKDQIVVEGNTVTVNFYLNGTSPTYPVIVPFSVSGDAIEGEDHSLVSGEVAIGKTNTASITFETFDDGIADNGETIVVSLSDTVNISSQSVQTITLSEENIAPEVILSAMQQNESRMLLSQADGEVIVTAAISDQNVTDTHALSWSSTSDELSTFISGEMSNIVSFDAAELSVGVHKLTVVVDDSGTPVASTHAEIYLEVVSTLPTLTDIDTDGDLIPDLQEGFGDQDGDGIADYLDAINDCNIMPETVGTQVTFLVEGESGVCLRKGLAATDVQSGSLLLTQEEAMQAVGEDTEFEIVGGIFDYVVLGLEKPGQEYKLVLPQRQPIPANAIYRKYTDSAGWSNFVEDAENQLFSTLGEPGFCPPPGSKEWQLGLTEGHWCVQLQVVDGGPNDNDSIANGSIVDPGGVGVYLNSNMVPVAEDDVITTIWNEAVTIDVLTNDVDPDGDELRVISASADFGVVEIMADTSLNYVPQTDHVGADTITYVVSDGNSGTVSAQVSITIIGNRIPIANKDSASTDDRTAININVLNNDVDDDGDTLIITSASATYGAAVIINNQVQYTPAVGFDGTDTVTYTISDEQGGEASATININVDAFESTTVVNESKSAGGSMSLLTLLLFPLLILRQRNNIKFVSFIMLALSALSLPAQAEWGVIASLGQAKANVSKAKLNSQLSMLDAQVVTLDDSDRSWRLGVIFQFDNNVFVDISYQDLGSFSVTIDGMTLDQSAFQQAAAEIQPISAGGISTGAGYQYKINEELYLGANIGLLFWENKNTSSGISTLKSEDSGTDVYYGIELGYQITSDLDVGLNYTLFNIDAHDIGNLTITTRYMF